MASPDSANPVTIRPAGEADVASLVELRTAFFQTQINAGLLDLPTDLPEMLAATTPTLVLGKRQHCLIAERAGTPIGYAVSIVRLVPKAIHSTVGSIEEVYISAAARRSGAGDRLVAESIATLRNAGAQRIQTRVLAENRTALAFWQRARFAPNVHILELEAGE